MKETIKKEPSIWNNNISFFSLLIFLTLVISSIGFILNWQVTYTKINPITGGLEQSIVAVENLLSKDGLRSIIGHSVTNFMNYTPLTLIIVALIGIGIAHKSGLLQVLFHLLGEHLSKYWLTFIIVFLGIISSFSSDVGYIILLPLAALFFLANNRNPIIGIFAAFASVGLGYSINFFAGIIDYSLAPYTEMAGLLIDESYQMSIYGNIFFLISSSIALTLFLTYLTESVIAPRIPKYKYDGDLIVDEIIITKKEKRGLFLAGVGFFVLFLMVIYMFIPGLPASGLLLDLTEESYLGQLFGGNAYFNQSIVYLISLLLGLCGWLYGIGAKTIKNVEDLSKTISNSLNNIGHLLLLTFLASQFIAIFKQTNLGTIITIWLMNLIETLDFVSLPLIILFFFFVAITNKFLVSSVTKWALISPVIVPLFMKANITPEFTQSIFRLGESVSNIITPLLPYFVIFIGFIQIYNKGEEIMPFTKCFKLLLIYVLSVTALWLFIIISWYVINLPLGINIYPTV
ncbi:MAG: AbgT family transporter [Bacilli bacterium]|jgi:aminobenzoyl-glutamate transport protein